MPTDDLADVIALLRKELDEDTHMRASVTADDLRLILDAAEANEAALTVLRDERDAARLAASAARDAALEEAAQIADSMDGKGGGFEEYPSGWDHACAAIAAALRARAQEMKDE